MAKHDVQNVSYMRKDIHFLADGTWYVTTPCPIHGPVDEEVAWAEAKTPHHAGLIADQRHVGCWQQLDVETQRAAAAAEIAAARAEVARAEQLVAAARAAVNAAEAQLAEEPFDSAIRAGLVNAPEIARMLKQLDHARRHVARHEHGLREARIRLQQTAAANDPASLS